MEVFITRLLSQMKVFPRCVSIPTKEIFPAPNSVVNKSKLHRKFDLVASPRQKCRGFFLHLLTQPARSNPFRAGSLILCAQKTCALYLHRKPPHMKQIILSALVLWLSAPLAAQQGWQISGYIRSETGEALPGSLVQINDTTGMVADADGFFRIQSDARPTVLIARCLGYFPRRIALRSDDFQAQKARVDVVLTAQETAIQEVSITAKKEIGRAHV